MVLSLTKRKDVEYDKKDRWQMKSSGLIYFIAINVPKPSEESKL